MSYSTTSIEDMMRIKKKPKKKTPKKTQSQLFKKDKPKRDL